MVRRNDLSLLTATKIFHSLHQIEQGSYIVFTTLDRSLLIKDKKRKIYIYIYIYISTRSLKRKIIRHC